MGGGLEYRATTQQYPDVFTPEARAALEALAPLDADRREAMTARIRRRAERIRERRRIAFLPADSVIPRTSIRVQDARDGAFDGSEIPPRPCAAGCATWRTRCSPAPTGGCSTARTRSGRW